MLAIEVVLCYQLYLTTFVSPLIPAPMMFLPAGTQQTDTCGRCLDEVCARCSRGGDELTDMKDVRTDGYPVCAEPPPGTTASASGTSVMTLSLEKGYYRTSNSSHVVLQCFQESACLGGDDADAYCAPGYTGPCENIADSGMSRCCPGTREAQGMACFGLNNSDSRGLINRGITQPP